MVRHLVGLIDGTMVSPSTASAYGSYSNVFELACLLQLSDRSDDGGPQIVFYSSGISSRPDTWSPYDLVTGNSIWSQIIDQYINICSNYNFDAPEGSRDKIYLFGFSRGAMAIRALAGLISEFGLLRPEHIRDLPIVLDAWNRSLGKPNLNPKVEVENAEVEFVGLFDSVMGGVSWLRTFNPIRFKNFKLPARCRRAVQILAIDENRRHFKPNVWDGITPRARKPDFDATRMLKQIWMPGLHSDVGGTGNAVWGRASFLAMVHFIKEHTNLGIRQSAIDAKEERFREGYHSRHYFIDQHRSIGKGFRRNPRDPNSGDETLHPICNDLETVTFNRRPGYPWCANVLAARFETLKVDPDLQRYFDDILQI